jgi:regulator of protease activity HflC (stomatin/prohibitin superfamily)
MGISSILGALSLLGFLLFLGGIATVVLSASQNRPVRSGVLLAVVGIIVGILFSVVSQGILIVQPTEVAVIFNTLNGDLEDPPRTAGTHIVVPVLQTVTIYPISQQEYTMSGTSNEGARAGNDAVAARTVDGQEVSLDITVLYAIDPVKANIVHRRWPTGYQDNFIRPTVRGFVRDVISAYRAVDIYGEQRTTVEQGIQDLLTARMAEEGFTLSDVLVRDITFSEQFSQSIENAQIAQQEAERARLVVQQRQQEAEQARAVAAGERDASITRAEGEAQAIVLRAQAEAQALELVAQVLSDNPNLIQYQYVQNLSDNVQLMLVPSNSPFLFDFTTLAESVPQPEATTEPGN